MENAKVVVGGVTPSHASPPAWVRDQARAHPDWMPKQEYLYFILLNILIYYISFSFAVTLPPQANGGIGMDMGPYGMRDKTTVGSTIALPLLRATHAYWAPHL
jgi:hypothetical protein